MNRVMHMAHASSWEVIVFTKPELYFLIPFVIFISCLVLLGVFF